MMYKYGDLVVFYEHSENFNYDPSYRYDLIYGRGFVTTYQDKLYKIRRYWNISTDNANIYDINRFNLYSDIFRELNDL